MANMASHEELEAAAEAIAGARKTVALTGAGISVESGVPHFRSAGGLWEVFDPMEYATLSGFLREPDKAWRLYRALGETLQGKTFNPAHAALADLEERGKLAGIITQNIDGFHQAAGNRVVLEIHGDHSHLECLKCHAREPFLAEHLQPGPVPHCGRCRFPLKPSIVLFEEPVRAMREIDELLTGCDLLLVVGTSAQVAPASLLPRDVLGRGGRLLEFNVEETELTRGGLGPGGLFIGGPAATILPEVARRTGSPPPSGP
jgi:NAD-dependent deacetylase